MRPAGNKKSTRDGRINKRTAKWIGLCSLFAAMFIVVFWGRISQERTETSGYFDISVEAIKIVTIEEKERLYYEFIVDNKTDGEIKNLSISMQPDQKLNDYLEFGSVVVPLGEYSLLSKDEATGLNDAYGVNCSCSLQLKEQDQKAPETILEAAETVTLFLKWDGREERHIIETTTK